MNSVLDPPEGRWSEGMLRTNQVGEKMMPQGIHYLAWDIETVRDPDMPTPEEAMMERKGGLPTERLFVPGEGEIQEPVRDLFPSPAQFKVVSCTGVALDAKLIPRHFIIFGRGKGESGIVWDFFRYLAANPVLKLVSWNGRRFDMPVMVARALAHGWSAAPWLRYRYRYVDLDAEKAVHLDLMDQLADYGGGQQMRLDHAAKIIGLPGKMEAKGDGVQDMWDAGRQEDIDDYCLTDSLQTAMLWQRVKLLSGQWARDQYRAVVQETMHELVQYQGGSESKPDKGRPKRRLGSSQAEGVDLAPFLLKINQERLYLTK